MDDFFRNLDELTKLENEEQELLEKQREIEMLLVENRRQQNIKEEHLVTEGKFHYTRSKRQEIIDKIKEMELPIGMVQELVIIDSDWESGHIKKDYVLSFTQYETRYFKETKKRRSVSTYVSKVVGFLNGGGDAK